MTTIIETAREFARRKHDGQMRAYVCQPYFNHLAEVAHLVTEAGMSIEAVAAAWLHDVIEDTSTKPAELEEVFGADITRAVLLLTDMPPVDGWNREGRKAYDRARLWCAPAEVQGIKCADLISNTRTIVEHNRHFASRYLPEKRAVLDVLTRAPDSIRWSARAVLLAAEKRLLRGES